MKTTTFGPAPRQQTSWDWRAAGNFMGGGAGAGLVVFAVLSGVTGTGYAVALLGGLALVGLGLLCVWMEIGRPLRALHVFFNPRSWMTREAMVATALFPVGLGSLYTPGLEGLALLLALGFVYCQARILNGAKGIPTWREPMLVPLVFVTGLAEGGGLFLLLQGARANAGLLVLLGLLVAGRLGLWWAYRRRLEGAAARPALAALDRSGRLLQLAGTWPPLVLAALAASGWLPAAAPALLAAAGLLAALAGAHFKHTLVTRAAFNQGFTIRFLPVRGARRSGP